jgi:2,3-dihydroxybenzoate-AMP ligase
LLQLPNVAEFLPICFALFRLGVVPVLALPAHRRSEIGHLARLSEAVAFVIVDQHLGFDYRELARSIQAEAASLRHVVVIGASQEFIDLSALDADPTDHPDPPAGEVALLLLSGGTTGLPKLIPRTHDDYVCNVRASAAAAGLDADTRYLVALPIAHNFALGSPGALGTLYAGGVVVFCRDPSPEVAFRMIEAERVTVTALIPPLASLWLEAVEWLEPNLSSLAWLEVGGARFKAELAAKVRPRLGCGLQQVYGMAEGLLNFTGLDEADHLALDTQGRPLTPDDDVRIVDADGLEVPAGEVGELQVRGPYTIRGYYRSEEYNRQAFTGEGFYRSGDLVRRLPSGHLVVEGRCKDVINRGGEKVPVEEVENHLLSHPAIVDVAIVGVPDDTFGERTVACIRVRNSTPTNATPTGATPTLAEVNSYLLHRGLASFKLPDRLQVLEHFPQTRLGKVDKGALAKQVAPLGRSRG